MVDVDGASWRISSAGTRSYAATLDPATVRAAADLGIDVSDHQSRPLDRHMLDDDGADLVLTMARSHLPEIVAIAPEAWPRTFTLKELARRASTSAPPAPDEGFARWRERMATGRQAREMLRPDPLDDVADPYGLPGRHHERMVADVASAVDRLVRAGPWAAVPRTDAAASAPRSA